MTESREIEVDGLAVEVDEAEYVADPEAVVASVRAARAELRLEPSDEEYVDFDGAGGDEVEDEGVEDDEPFETDFFALDEEAD